MPVAPVRLWRSYKQKTERCPVGFLTKRSCVRSWSPCRARNFFFSTGLYYLGSVTSGRKLCCGDAPFGSISTLYAEEG